MTDINPTVTPTRFPLNENWTYLPYEDKYEHRGKDFYISKVLVFDEMRNWGRQITEMGTIAVLERLYGEFKNATK